MAGVGSHQSLRKAFGVLKDSTKVGLAKVNSDYKELDIAIVKATNHVERMSKEKHVRTIFHSVSAARPRADVAYCIHSLGRRLSKTHSWAVALKTLILIHRGLREVDSTFREELMNYTKSKGHMLNLSHFKDDSNQTAWDYSAWVRMYALYLEERLVCFRVLKYDIETQRSRTRELDTPDLLEQLPALQQLLFRLIACTPEGAARYNNVLQYALSLVASESVRIYAAINDATLNLVDKFFEMQQQDAVRALEIYKKTGVQALRLSEFYETCRSLEFGKRLKCFKIEQPPASFLATMEEYVKEAPRPLMLQWNSGNDDKATPKTVGTPDSVLPMKPKGKKEVEEESEPSISEAEVSTTMTSEAPVAPPAADLLGWDETDQDTSDSDESRDESNAHALAIIPTEDPLNPTNCAVEFTGWELALVTAPSSNSTFVADSKLAGGTNKLDLDCLYGDAMAKQTEQNSTYHSGQVPFNPFELDDLMQEPFYASKSIAPPMNVQMETMTQQQQGFMMQHQHQNHHEQHEFLHQHEQNHHQQQEFMQQHQQNHLEQQEFMMQYHQHPQLHHHYQEQQEFITRHHQQHQQQEHHEQPVVSHNPTNPFC